MTVGLVGKLLLILGKNICIPGQLLLLTELLNHQLKLHP